MLASNFFCIRLGQTLVTITVLALASAGRVSALDSVAGEEEFIGPLAGWRDVKTFYGAKGDGKADDTAALQRGFDDLVQHSNFCVLYFPAGRYRLTATLKTLRTKHTDGMGIAIIGESPTNTTLVWDGPRGGTVVQYDAWYSKISRLGIDGAGRAKNALAYGPTFSTYNESSDLFLANVVVGIMFGGGQAAGQAENEVLRCHFTNCTDDGVRTGGFNSMDIWVWYSEFTDCGHALFNGAGNFHAWQNLFLRSRVADIGSANLMVFSFVNNTSIGSRRFLDFDTGHSWGSPMTISGNRILDPADDFPIKLGNGGPYLVLDNVIRLPAGSAHQAAKMTWGDQTFAGNCYSVANAVKEDGRFRRLAEKTVDPLAIKIQAPELPGIPQRSKSTIIEVRVGADAAAIQQAIDRADSLRGQHPVVHLPMGVYQVARTLVVPAQADLQIIGDSAAETGTRLQWVGAPGGLVLDLKGPTHVALKDFHIDAGKSRALLVENADQPGGRIFADQLNVTINVEKNALTGTALLVNGLEETDVLLRCLQGNGNAGHWVEVARGQPNVSTIAAAPANQISIFNGATGPAVGQYSLRDGGRLLVRGVYHEADSAALSAVRLAGSGTLTIDSSRLNYRTAADIPTISLEDFGGTFTLASSILMPVGSTSTCRIRMTGRNAGASVLALNDLFWVYEPGVVAQKVWLNQTVPPVPGGLIGCNQNHERSLAGGGTFGTLENVGQVSDSDLLRHLAPIREARVWLPTGTAANATDLRISRVMAVGSGPATVEFRRGKI